VNGMIPVDPGQTETVREAYIHSRPKTTRATWCFGPDGPSNKAKVTLTRRERCRTAQRDTPDLAFESGTDE